MILRASDTIYNQQTRTEKPICATGVLGERVKLMAKNRKLADLEDRENRVEARVPQQLYDAIASFADRMDSPTMSDAVRELLTMGLANATDLEDRFIEQANDNARRGAIRRMQGVMRAAMAAATEAFGDESEEGFAEEELDEE